MRISHQGGVTKKHTQRDIYKHRVPRDKIRYFIFFFLNFCKKVSPFRGSLARVHPNWCGAGFFAKIFTVFSEKFLNGAVWFWLKKHTVCAPLEALILPGPFLPLFSSKTFLKTQNSFGAVGLYEYNAARHTAKLYNTAQIWLEKWCTLSHGRCEPIRHLMQIYVFIIPGVDFRVGDPRVRRQGDGRSLSWHWRGWQFECLLHIHGQSGEGE